MKFNTFSTILVILLLLSSFFLYIKMSNIEYRFETYKTSQNKIYSNQNLTLSQIKERDFKEDMYIRQQERDTNLILIVFTILLGFTAFTSHIFVKREFKTNVRKIEEQHANNSRDINEKHNMILKLEKDLNFQVASNYSKESSYFLKIKDYEKYLLISIQALHKYILVLNNSKDENVLFTVSVDKIIKEIIDELYIKIPDIEIKTYFIQFETYKYKVSLINEYLDKEYLLKFTRVISKLEII